MRTPCAQCPWRLSNHGKRHPGGFYRKSNMQRLWNQLRRGGMAQSCHLTDPSHPDHIASGAPLKAQAQECPGSVIVIIRELRKVQGAAESVGTAQIDTYLAANPRGLTRSGLRYWLLMRASALAGTLLGGKPLPDVDETDPLIGHPNI